MGKKAIILEHTESQARDYGSMLVRYHNMNVNICTDYVKAVKATEKFDPDIIFMEMNNIKGIECDALKEIRGHEQLKDIPVVIVSNNKNPQIIKQAFDFGITHYFAKPLNKQKFDAKITEIFRSLGF